MARVYIVCENEPGGKTDHKRRESGEELREGNVCICVFMHVYMCAAVYVCVLLCAYMNTLVCVNEPTYAYACVIVCMRTCVCMHLCTCVYVCVCMFAKMMLKLGGKNRER